MLLNYWSVLYCSEIVTLFLETVIEESRFIAHVEIAGQTETVHVKNTGRCRELLIPGVQVFLEKSSNPARKTAYDLV